MPTAFRIRSVANAAFDEKFAGYALVLPALVILMFLYFLPIVATTVFSFTDYSLVNPWGWVGFENYAEVFTSEQFRIAAVNTVVFTAGTVIPSIIVGLVMAAFLEARIRCKWFFRLALYAPALTSLVTASMVWIWAYDAQLGIVNQALALVGIKGPNWLNDPDSAMPALIIMSVWRSFGFCMLVYVAALQGISKDLYEAADLDGANWWRKFTDITIPSLRPITFFLVVTVTVSAFQAFDAIFVMTKGGPNSTTTTVVHQIYRNGFEFGRMGYASAMALVLFWLLVGISAINGLGFRRKPRT
jgi:ABC-type sugar transport system permease subunit